MYENMIQLYQKITQLRVLELFLQNPFEGFYLRESARLLDMDPMTVKRSLDLLFTDGLLEKYEEKNRILYRIDLDNQAARYQKISYNLAWLKEKGVVEYINNMGEAVTAIIMFGSFARGENDGNSDLDLLMISLGKNDLSQEIGQILDHEVNLMNFTPAQWSEQAKKNRAFYTDVITEGIALFGQIPMVE
jgi:predicted nucleotidyltransferase